MNSAYLLRAAASPGAAVALALGLALSAGCSDAAAPATQTAADAATDAAPPADTGAAADSATAADNAQGPDAAAQDAAAADAGAADSTAADTAAADTAAADTPSGGCAFTPAPAGTSQIVINEVQGKTDDWVELRNNGTAKASLAGMIVADRGPDGCPRLDAALTFPAEATIPAGGYVVIIGGKKTPAPGIQTKCLPAGPPECYHAGFKVGVTSGDSIFLLQGKQIVDTAEVLAGAIPADTKTWARIPNGTGKFQLASPTPGLANKP